MSKGKRRLGVLIVLLGVLALAVWEMRGKTASLSGEILVMNKNVPKGVTVTETMLKPLRAETGENDCLKPAQKREILGKETAGFVHKGVPLFREYFRDQASRPKGEEGEYILSLPVHWVDSSPGTLTKGDRIYIYGGSAFIASSRVAYTGGEKKDIEIIVKDEEIKKITAAIQHGDKLVIAGN